MLPNTEYSHLNFTHLHQKYKVSAPSTTNSNQIYYITQQNQLIHKITLTDLYLRNIFYYFSNMTQHDPEYEKVNLRDGLPKLGAQEVLEELRRTLFENQNWKDKYYPPEKQAKYLNNFKLFDRNADGMLDYDELKQFLVSIGQVFPEGDLLDYYKYLRQNPSTEPGQGDYGIVLDNIYLIVTKKLKDQKLEEQLQQSFKIVDEKNQGMIQSEYFKELLMTMGYKWTEEQADEFLKDFDPKGEGKFSPSDVIKKLIKR